MNIKKKCNKKISHYSKAKLTMFKAPVVCKVAYFRLHVESAIDTYNYMFYKAR